MATFFNTQLVVFFIVGITYLAKSQTQTRYQTTADHQQNVSAYIGVGQTRFMNPVFSQNLKDKVLKPGTGFAIGFSYITYPLLVSFGHFTSNFKVSGHDWQYEEGTKVTHSGFEIGANLLLLPQIKQVQPYIGGGYHNSSLAVRVSDSEDGQNKGLPKSSLKMSTGVWRAGLSAQFNRLLGMRLDYQRSMSIKKNYKSFYKLGLCATFNLSK